MKMKTKDLKPGIVMATGEVVISAVKFLNNGEKMQVELLNPVKNTKRISAWSYKGTVFVKEPNE